jgi:hypothetical protein
VKREEGEKREKKGGGFQPKKEQNPKQKGTKK